VILVTGTSGFVGKKLLAALVEEYGAEHILALTSKPTSLCRYLLHHDYSFGNDYLLKSGYSSIDTVIHAGAFIPKNASESNDWIQCSSNIANTEKLLKLELPQLKKFIFLSTIDVYGKDAIITEESPVDPPSLYGHSKLYCEKMISSWAKANHKIAQVLRIGHIYGPGEEAYQKLIPLTMQKLLLQQPLQIWGTGIERRSFLYIGDLISTILKSLKIDGDLGTVNLVSSTSVSVRELINMILEISEVKTSIETIPVQGEGRSLVFDNSKLQSEIGLSEISLSHGLSQEWEHMKQLKR
jgi:UDP-glucose 4-epimerase